MGAAVEKGWKSIFDDLYNIWNALIYHGYIKKTTTLGNTAVYMHA